MDHTQKATTMIRVRTAHLHISSRFPTCINLDMIDRQCLMWNCPGGIDIAGGAWMVITYWEEWLCTPLVVGMTVLYIFLNSVEADDIELENGVGDRNMFNCGKGIGITPHKAEPSAMTEKHPFSSTTNRVGIASSIPWGPALFLSPLWY
jgi:hypothetical protein